MKIGMIPFIVTWISAFLIWLILSAGTGPVLLWSWPELVAGAIVSLVVGIIARSFYARNNNYRMLNPVRWMYLVVYICIPFFLEMARANIDVACRVITGKINPGIVRYNPELTTDLGQLLLANSITLTPGTLTVEVDEKTGDFYIHMLNVRPETEKKEECESGDIFSLFNFTKWIRRIAE